MTQLAMSLVLLWSLFATQAFASDFFLRIEEVGYENVADDGQKPVAKLLSSLQLAIRPDEAYSGRAEIAGRKIVVRGTCKPSKKPDFVDLQIRVDFYRATGQFVTGPGGVERAVVNKSAINTIITARVGEPLIIGGLASIKFDVAAGSRNSERKIILLVSTSEPEDDDTQRPDQ